jgi:chromate transporter
MSGIFKPPMEEKNKSGKPSARRLFLSFLRLGLTAFGGPAMIEHIRAMSVNRFGWLDEETFRDGVAICQSVPGATAMQMAAYVGLRTGGVPGALCSYTGFGLPAFVLMVLLSSLYAGSHDLPQIVSLFSGLQVIVVAIIAGATRSFGLNILKTRRDVAIAVLAAALFGAGVSPFAVIAGAALTGILMYRNYSLVVPSAPAGEMNKNIFKHVIMVFFIFIAALAGLYLCSPKLFSLAALMVRVDLFAFGGGFASLPLLLHEVVNMRGWLDSKTFMDGIALGQVTPGPIVITSTFVGYLMYGLSGAVVATLAIFSPSFMVLAGVTPFFDRLKSSGIFLRAVKGILASFVGLLFFVTVRFASAVPWDAVRLLLAAAAFIALIRKVDILYVVLAGAALSLIIF